MIALAPQSVTCFGQCNGSIISSVNPPGGYTYQWTPTNSPTQHLTGVCAGAYTLTVIDQNGCMNSNTTIVNQPVSLTSVVFPTPATSCNACDGYASIATSGGTPPYSYAWNTDQLSKI
ncbi:MAG: hypothetical protein IPG89_20055 [Bacteroidetes bacterium]|nr:hypothetical protein [Bacteroidota bacterium]